MTDAVKGAGEWAEGVERVGVKREESEGGED